LQRIIPTGCGSLDEQLKGGLLEGTLSLLYGEAETGKTTLAIQCAVNCARIGRKTIFIDCDGTFSPKRMAQIALDDFDKIAPQIILMQPEDFDQQAIVVERLDEYISARVGLIVVDTVTGLYRERLGDVMQRNFSLNRELNRQMACLAQITKTRKVASLAISQVRSLVSDGEETVQPVAMRVLKFWADTTITLQPTAQNKLIKAAVETRAEKRPTKLVLLQIEEKGLSDYRG
jgi:DNA repair protein RadB